MVGTRKRIARRTFLAAAGAGAVGLVGARFAVPRLLAARPIRPLSKGARRVGDEALEGLDLERVWDGHVHLVGTGAGDTGCWVNPRVRSPWHPIERLRYDIYLAASGVEDQADADREYLERLLGLQRDANPRGAFVALAFDLRVREDGTEDRERSAFYTPNEYVLAVAREHPEVIPCASIHPYRADAEERLRAAVEAGARGVKWVPNSMRIDLLSPRCDLFYRALAETGLPLVTHVGREQAVPGAEQEWGNPLRLRRPLEAGVRVVAAHAASLGDDLDLDAPEKTREEVPAFDLLIRLFEEPRWVGLLFADISALTLAFRSGRPLRELLRREDLHPRLLYGSDYPLPAIRWMTNLSSLVRSGVLDASDADPLDEMRSSNPLLFDLVLKRRLRLLEKGRAYRFPSSVFETAPFFS